jgi:hypothetical protein
MRVGARLASAQFTSFARLCAAGRATSRQGFLQFGIHGYTLRRLAPTFWSIVTSMQSIFVEY